MATTESRPDDHGDSGTRDAGTRSADSTTLTPETDGCYIVDGRPVALPVVVRSAEYAAATFLVHHSAAQQVIGHTGLLATRQRGNKAIASLALVDYLDNDLGTYKELALAFVVDNPEAAAGPPGTNRDKTVNTLIHRLPVSESFTCSAGRGIWGFPKWVADLSVDFTATGAHCVLRDGDTEVLRISLRRGRLPIPRRPLPMNAYTFFDDGLLRVTPWTTSGTGRQTIRPGGATLQLGYGHPIADELRTLGMPKKALMTLFDPAMSATFGPPRLLS